MKSEFARRIREDFEPKAKNCLTCDVQGACCQDAHFVNVHITRLEAVEISEVLDALPSEKRDEVRQRIEEAIAKYDLLSAGDTFAKTYACPLFERGTGCLVHHRGKPLVCIAHACYENKDDLPPDELLAEQEERVEKLNERTYRRSAGWLALPVAVIDRMSSRNALPVSLRSGRQHQALSVRECVETRNVESPSNIKSIVI